MSRSLIGDLARVASFQPLSGCFFFFNPKFESPPRRGGKPSDEAALSFHYMILFEFAKLCLFKVYLISICN